MPSSTRRPAPRAGTSRASIRGVASPRRNEKRRFRASGRRPVKPRFRSLLPLVALVLAAAISDATAQQRPYNPSLGDLMTATVQPRHTKLGLATREGNWPYAAYELHELKEAFDRAAKVWPKWRTFSISEMMASVTKEPMAALERAIMAGDPNRVTTAYEQLTAACNTCHRSADRGMIVIQSPTSASFPDQDFRPVKQ